MDRSQDLCFALETPSPLGDHGKRRRKDRQRHLARQPGVAGPENFPHRPRAERRYDLVHPQPRSEHGEMIERRSGGARSEKTAALAGRIPVIRKQDALEYHRRGRKGKIEVAWTKPCATQRDLSLAYTPGVADPCREIAASADAAYEYTAKGNLVAVVTNGTAVLGLGDIGPLAGKPVMEGKAVLFKRFADIDVFDLEIDAKDPGEVARIVRALAPTFGGVNLEDIKAP